MIKIDKDIFPPEVRYVKTGHPFQGQLKWRVLERKVIRDYLNDITPFIEGKYPFSTDFGYDEFRNVLENNQGPKCCFCEKPIDGGAIEHFRPKKAWQQAKGNPINWPGYYWLAYRWANMLISCSECNSAKQKGVLFPVNGFRATNHTMDYRNEKYSIINPAYDEPSIHITFTGSLPIANDQRGADNISIFNLDNRGDINSIRKDRFDLYLTQKEISEIAIPTPIYTISRITQAKIFINKAKKRKAPFAGMILENIKNGIL